jgi:hypothetical protein
MPEVADGVGQPPDLRLVQMGHHVVAPDQHLGEAFVAHGGS